MKSNYKPQPIDTKDVQLSDELNELVEIVAKNVHEVWAQSRIEQGWSFGVERNDVQKKHPCLLPYENLAEEEKDYDRKTVLKTLRVITKLGFTIKK